MLIQTDLHSFSYKKGSLIPQCKQCTGQHFYRDGKNSQELQRYRCRNCHFRFVWTSDEPRSRYFSTIKKFAVKLYTSLRVAASLRGVAQIVQEVFSNSVSYETVKQWVLQSKKQIHRRKNKKATTWHIDETYIKIKGKGHWLWIVRCRSNGQVLAWHLTKKRTIKAATHVIHQAYQVAGCKPKRIITDGLEQYTTAIKKVIGWHWREQKKRHIKDSGVGKNWFIERLNREIKRRIKWFSTFQSFEGANAFFSSWFHHWNQTHIT